MNYLTLHDLRLGLEDLLAPGGARLNALGSTKSWSLYGAETRKKSAEIVELLSPINSPPKSAENLVETDQLHDGYGGAFWYLTEAYLRAPSTSSEQREVLLALRRTFMSEGLKELKAGFSDEAARARARLPLLEENKQSLLAIPLIKGTLFDWVESFLRHGEALTTLMSERAMPEINGPRPVGGSLRSTTIGLLKALRSALQFELTQDTSLPRNLDSLIFEYFDQLDERRAANAAPAPEAEKPPTP